MEGLPTDGGGNLSAPLPLQPTGHVVLTYPNPIIEPVAVGCGQDAGGNNTNHERVRVDLWCRWTHKGDDGHRDAGWRVAVDEC